MIDRDPLTSLLVKLRNFAEGTRQLSSFDGNKRVYAFGEELDKIVDEYHEDVKKMTMADTKKDLAAVKLPGEDAYSVDLG